MSYVVKNPISKAAWEGIMRANPGIPYDQVARSDGAGRESFSSAREEKSEGAIDTSGRTCDGARLAEQPVEGEHRMSRDAADNLMPVLKGMAVGTDYIYHVGFLIDDRTTRPGLHRVAAMIFGLYRAGCVELYQKRMTDRFYEYHLRVISPVRDVDLQRSFKLWDTRMEDHGCK